MPTLQYSTIQPGGGRQSKRRNQFLGEPELKLLERKMSKEDSKDSVTLQSVLKDNKTKRKLLMSQDTRLKSLVSEEYEIKQKLKNERKKVKILAMFKKQRDLEDQKMLDFKMFKESLA